jgi:hypothetical protein
MTEKLVQRELLGAGRVEEDVDVDRGILGDIVESIVFRRREEAGDRNDQCRPCDHYGRSDDRDECLEIQETSALKRGFILRR